jgi:hypothetical protein
MTEPRNNDDRCQARSEAATLLGVDIDHLSPADSLRVDMVSALRLVIDHEQGCVLSGGSADLGKLNVAVQSLIALLPGRELPAPESQREDPREVMFKIYMEMRERGEVPPEGHFQHRINELELENERLRAALGGSSAITPREADITPPGELGECYAGSRPGPDDPKPPVTIEGKAVAASAPAKPVRPQNWDSTPGGKAWRAWHDAGGYGGPGFDRWSNRNF